MAYEPTNWKSGDVVTSTKLNNMESGIVSATPFIVNMLFNDQDKSYLDKTGGEIAEAMKKGPVVVVDIGDDYACSWLIVNGWTYPTEYTFRIMYEDQPMTFTTTSADEYPVEV